MLSRCVNWLTQKRAEWIIHCVRLNQRIYVAFCFIKCLQIYQSFLSAICFCKVILPNNCNKYSFVLKVKHYLCENLMWVSNTITMLVGTKRKVVMGWVVWVFELQSSNVWAHLTWRTSGGHDCSRNRKGNIFRQMIMYYLHFNFYFRAKGTRNKMSCTYFQYLPS